MPRPRPWKRVRTVRSEDYQILRGCERVHDGTPDGGEDLVVELVPRSAIPGLIRAGEIRHALHVAALHLALVAEKG